MTIKKILEGRPFGHPIHPLIVHLPLGLWLLGAILDVIGFAYDGQRWALTGAAWSIAIGTAVAIFAALTGINDWLDIRSDHPAQKTVLWHMAMMLPSTMLFGINTVLHFANRTAEHVTVIMMVVSLVAYALAIVGGYLGGLLVYDDGIAVGRHRRTTELPQNTVKEPRKGTMEAPLAPSQGLAADYHPILPEAALGEGQTLRAEVGGNIFMLVRAEGQIYAVQDFCTHRCGPLSEGAVCGKEIRCPWHNSQFDLSTGKVTKGPAKVDLRTYEVRVKGGIIHVAVDRGAPSAPPAPDRPAERRNPEESPAYSREGRQEGAARRTPSEAPRNTQQP
jgi:nitrite reductase/ring-hydroxylating ferredoxin subunit/uncharacterized membrane protein